MDSVIWDLEQSLRMLLVEIERCRPEQERYQNELARVEKSLLKSGEKVAALKKLIRRLKKENATP